MTVHPRRLPWWNYARPPACLRVRACVRACSRGTRCSFVWPVCVAHHDRRGESREERPRDVLGAGRGVPGGGAQGGRLRVPVHVEQRLVLGPERPHQVPYVWSHSDGRVLRRCLVAPHSPFGSAWWLPRSPALTRAHPCSLDAPMHRCVCAWRQHGAGLQSKLFPRRRPGEVGDFQHVSARPGEGAHRAVRPRHVLVRLHERAARHGHAPGEHADNDAVSKPRRRHQYSKRPLVGLHRVQRPG